jgi:hypothetical protein
LESALEDAHQEADGARAQQLKDVTWFMQTLREIRGGASFEEVIEADGAHGA